MPDQVNKWMVAITVMLPTIIVIVGSAIVTVSLGHIRGSLSAGVDEATWAVTAYLAAGAVVIPMSGWFSRFFGRKRFLQFSVALFTVSSMLCGMAWSIQSLIAFRILQGLAGGSLQPISQSILLETFPPSQHGTALAIFSIGIMFGPIMAPLLGGWITDNWSWPWIFYINLPIGIVSMAMSFFFIVDPPYMRGTVVKVDYWGLLFLALWVGCLQMVLDRGQSEEWFESGFIVTLTVIASVSFALFILAEHLTDHPIVELGVFRDYSFAFGNIVVFFVLASLFGSLVLLPIYLLELMGYTASLAGLILGPGGLAIFAVMPIVGRLVNVINPKYIAAIGVIVIAHATYLMAGFNMQADFNSILWPRVLVSVGMGMVFIPLNLMTLSGIPPMEMGNATSIFGLMRNVGSGLGVAFATTILARRSQFHQSRLVENMTPFDSAYWDTAQQSAAMLQQKGMDIATSQQGGLALIYNQLVKQASMMSFNDVFFVMAVMMICMLPLVLFMRYRRPAPAPKA